MNPRRTLATAWRVLRQIRPRPAHDRACARRATAAADAHGRLLDCRPQAFQRVGPPLVGLFPFIVVFLVTSIAMPRERTSGTLERLMTPAAGEARSTRRLRVGIRRAGVRCRRSFAVGVGFGLLGLDATHGVLCS
jgi:ABC-2 type transport system permease protein